MLKAIFFDMDGTIGDSLPLCLKAFKKTVEPILKRKITDDEIFAAFGATEEGTLKILVPGYEKEAKKTYLTYYESMHDLCPAPFPGIIEILQWLKSKNILLAVITGKGQETCAIDLRYYQIEHLIDCVETGSPLGLRKTEAILGILENHHLSPEETLYIGDTPSDIIHARAAGVRTIAALWGTIIEEDAVKKQNPFKICYTVKALDEYLKDLI